jgi:hypothetical protein
MRVIRLLLVLFICAVPAFARADTIPLAGVLSLPSVANIPSETINYDLTVDTSLQQFIGVDGQSHTAFLAVLGGTVLIFAQPANQLVSTINLAGNGFERLLNEPPQTLLEFGAWRPYCFGDPVYVCNYPPPDWALIKKFDLIAFDLNDVRWVETDGPVATPEGSTRSYLLVGVGLGLLGMLARTQKYRSGLPPG